MLQRIRNHRVSFSHAFDGLIHSFKTQPNFQIHLLAATISICLGLYFSITYLEWIILAFTINLVLTSELINTAIESIVDLISSEWKKDAKIAKDVSAAMVLVSAILAIIVGIFIFLPKIIISI